MFLCEDGDNILAVLAQSGPMNNLMALAFRVPGCKNITIQYRFVEEKNGKHFNGEDEKHWDGFVVPSEKDVHKAMLSLEEYWRKGSIEVFPDMKNYFKKKPTGFRWLHTKSVMSMFDKLKTLPGFSIATIEKHADGHVKQCTSEHHEDGELTYSQEEVEDYGAVTTKAQRQKLKEVGNIGGFRLSPYGEKLCLACGWYWDGRSVICPQGCNLDKIAAWEESHNDDGTLKHG